MKVKTLILIIINSLIVLVVAVLSFSFYRQFSEVLNNRILLQLNSIKTLKQNQLENLIKAEWKVFLASEETNQNIDTTTFILSDAIKQQQGVFDFTPYHVNKKTTIGFIATTKKGIKTKILNYDSIEKVLLERTGMGESGESYIVGKDSRMRSRSRFFPNKIPYTIQVRTEGVKNALLGKEGRGVFKDYRGIDVYSVYSPITISGLKLVILSEIDVSEVLVPLKRLKTRLIGLTLGILLIAIVLSLLLTRIITIPIRNMQQSLKVMADGDYYQSNEFRKNSDEIKEMFDALASLKESLQGAVKFSEEIGKMNLNAQYAPKSNSDMLGKSLLVMRDKLIKYRDNEENNRILARRMLVDGLEKERRRLSRELHDGVGPYLTTLKHYIENRVEHQQKKVEMKRIVDDTISEIRLMSNALVPSSIDDFGVGVALANFIENLKKSTYVNIEFEDLTKQEDTSITNHQGINLFRIGQELINNSLKHSKAENIRITLSEFDDFISLFYYDDGIGFDKKNRIELGSGMVNIKERVKVCNGKIVVNSKIGNTTFEIELPVENYE